MKYVIFKTENKHSVIYNPVIIPEHVTHSLVKIDEWEGKERKPINVNKIHSAGFFYLKKGFVVVESRISESLNVGPAINDDKILSAVLLNAGSSFFIEYL